MTESEFRSAIEDLGLVASVVTGDAATSPDDVGDVYAVDPTGPVAEGSTVTGTIHAPIAAIEDPTTAPRMAGDADPTDLTTGEPYTIEWDAATCPAGYTLAGYDVTILWANGDEVVEQVNGSQLNITQMPTGDNVVSYAYRCDIEGGETLTSGSSPTLTMTAAPEETPTPEPTPEPTPTPTLPVLPPEGP